MTSIPRERILRAAASQFRQHGYKGTTVRDIAQEVGILSGSLFHHFKSKEEILVEIMRQAFLDICEMHESLLARETDPLKQLRGLVRNELDVMITDVHRDYHAVLYFEWREAPEASMPELRALRKRFQGCWLQALRGCYEIGRLRCEPDMAERIINGAMRGVMTWFRQGGRYTTEELCDLFVHLFTD